MVNQTDQLKSVFGDALGSPEGHIGFLNPDTASKIKDKASEEELDPLRNKLIQTYLLEWDTEKWKPNH